MLKEIGGYFSISQSDASHISKRFKRYTYWNAIMRRRIGGELTGKFAAAHESETPDGSVKKMDLHNNKGGRIIGKVSGRRIVQRVLKALYNNKLIVIKWSNNLSSCHF